MTPPTHDWARWFTGYAVDADRDDPAPLAARYGRSFLAAAPAGTGTFPNDERFLDWLRQVRAHNVAAARFRVTGERPVVFEISYLMTTGTEPTVVAYVSHEDQDQAMRRFGITPPDVVRSHTPAE